MISPDSLQVSKKIVKATVANKTFCSFNFHLKIQIILWATNIVCCFLLLYFIFFLKNSLPDTQV